MKRTLFALSLLLLLVTLAACGGAMVKQPPVAAAVALAESAPSSTPPPTAAPPSAPSPTPPPPTAAPTETAPPPTERPTATPDSNLLTIPAVNCCRGRTLEPGQYTTPSWLGIPLAIELGEGWRVLNEARAQLLLIGRGQNVQNNPSQIITFINATGATATPERVIDAVRAIPQLTPLGDPVSVAIAGFPGWQVDLLANANPDEKGDASADIPPGIQYLPYFQQYFAPGFIWSTSSPEARVRVAAVKAGEQTLLLYMEAPAAEFDQFIADADALLWSLRVVK